MGWIPICGEENKTVAGGAMDEVGWHLIDFCRALL